MDEEEAITLQQSVENLRKAWQDFCDAWGAQMYIAQKALDLLCKFALLDDTPWNENEE